MDANRKQQSPIAWVLGQTGGHGGQYVCSVILAVIGVAFSVAPYFVVAGIIHALMEGRRDFDFYLTRCLIMAGLYVARNVVNNRNMLMLLGVLPDIPEALLFWGVVGVFTFLGVLIFVDFLMHGLTYKKVGKLQVRIRRKGE